MAELFIYNANLFLNVLQIISGLLIFGTLLKKFRAFAKFTEGAYFLLAAAILIMAKDLMQIFMNLGQYNEVVDTLIYLLFALGIVYFTGKLKLKKNKK